MISSTFPAKNMLMVYDANSGHYRSLTSDDTIKSINKTSLNELTIASRNSYIDIPSVYGISQVNDETGIFFNASIIENSGLLELQTANQTGSNSYIQSIKRGINHCGSNGTAIIDFKINSAPTGGQYSRWGYYDGVNGAGYGMDQSGLYIFKLINSNYDKIYRQNWGQNTLSGANNNFDHFNPINYSYCYGMDISNNNLKNFIVLKNSETNEKQKVYIHSWDDPFLIDKNQPLKVEVNNLEDVGQLKCFVGNRNYSIIGGSTEVTRRPMVSFISKYTMSAAQNVWVPIMSVRKKENFGPSARPNSVNTRLHAFSALSDQDAEFMLTINGNITGTNWVTPDFRNSNETACEIQKITNNNLGISVTGQVVAHESLFASNKQDSDTSSEELTYFGNGGELIMFARRTTSNATIISATLHWDEEY